MLLPDARQMRELDRRTMEDYGIPGLVLMENAGRGAVEALVRRYGPVTGRPLAIFCGPGNNGGDGLVMARHLHQLGAHPLILLLAEAEHLRGDAAVNLRIVRQLELPLWEITGLEALQQAQQHLMARHHASPFICLVDALFGTGLTRVLTGVASDGVQLINTMRRELACPVLAVDIPSGLDADTGRVQGACVGADLTVTFGLPKPGLLHHGGGGRVGRLELVDIGIPAAVVASAGIRTELLTPATMAALAPRRPVDAHKGTCGHLLLLAGSRGKTGAAILAALAGLRAGAGLVTLAAPRELLPIYAGALPEAMTLPLASNDCLTGDDWPCIAAALAGKNAVVLGPGLGTAPATAALVQRLWLELPLPMVVDADALTMLAAAHQFSSPVPAPRLLTPHPGEMARLIGNKSCEVQEDRGQAADWLRHHQGDAAPGPELYTILKGAGTLVSGPDGRQAINATGNAGMAAGGMGDVLAGLLGALLAQGLDGWDAARLGVFLHGLAADLLARRRPHGFLASEVAHALPEAMADLLAAEASRPPALNTQHIIG
ncbi:MAG: hypothetical protein BWK76_03745 [Desulfobulbaceae bacterium A2]|nr:MAG: hypothetical protein BWK76_03745 [Desulfobulbaceae bacterium A2]